MKMVISAGMPRAGSGWYYNLVHDLVVASGGQNARTIRKRYHLGSFLTEVNCNISTLRFQRLFPVLIPAFLGNEYVIKTHAEPTKFFKSFQHRGKIKSTYIFRDPRAALLSAYEYGQRGLTNGRPNAFSHLMTLESAADFMDDYVQIWAKWSTTDDVLMVKYEDLVADFDTEIERLSTVLGLDFSMGNTRIVLGDYRPEQGNALRKGTHFHRGDIERYRQEFTPTHLERLTEKFKPVLDKMDYPL